MGKILFIDGADYSYNSISTSKIIGTPGYTLTPSLGEGLYTLNDVGICFIKDIVVPNSQGQFALGTYGVDNNNITNIEARWNVKDSGITSFTQLFCNLIGLVSLNCSNLITEGIEDFTHTFKRCVSLKSIDLSTWNSNTHYASSAYMFNECYALEWVDLGNIIIKYGANNTFSSCRSLKKVRTKLTEQLFLDNIKSVLNNANAGGSSNWTQGIDDDGCIMFIPNY